MKYAFVEAHRKRFQIKSMCRVLQVSRSGYYGWRTNQPSVRDKANLALLQQIRQHHARTGQAYGALKMWRHLSAMGQDCGKHRVARLRSQHGIEARRMRRFRAKYAARNGEPPAPRLLRWPFVAKSINEVWVGDITFIATRQGWLHLAILLDLYSRHVVGWAMAGQQTAKLTIAALDMAVARRLPQPGLIHHTDQGAQYSSAVYRQRLDHYGLVASMSRKGNCYDNAVAESFFSTLKNELVHDQDFKTRDQAKTAIFEYLEVFYNRQRIHQSIGYVSPSDYEAMRIGS